jgi:hypothetical protein
MKGRENEKGSEMENEEGEKRLMKKRWNQKGESR